MAISSVSRVLSGHPDVSPAMRAAVNDAVQELGYRPNALARGLRSQRSMSVGFAVADIANPIFADIVRGAERELRANGYSMLLTNSEGDAQLDAGNLALLEDRQVDGLLLSLTQEGNPDVVQGCGPRSSRWCCSTATSPTGSRLAPHASITGPG